MTKKTYLCKLYIKNINMLKVDSIYRDSTDKKYYYFNTYTLKEKGPAFLEKGDIFTIPPIDNILVLKQPKLFKEFRFLYVSVNNDPDNEKRFYPCSIHSKYVDLKNNLCEPHGTVSSEIKTDDINGILEKIQGRTIKVADIHYIKTIDEFSDYKRIVTKRIYDYDFVD